MQGETEKMLVLDSQIKACETPIQLKNRLHIQSHELLAIVSDAPIYLHGIAIWSATPICILDPHDLEIRPVQDLGPKFVKGWKSLPTELKCTILAWGLTEDEPIPVPYAWDRMERHDFDYRYSMLMEHLHMTPEIASLATRIFYESNTFELCVTMRRGYTSSSDVVENRRLETISTTSIFTYPHLALNRYIKTIIVRIKTYACYWYHVRRLAKGFYGFPALKHITIIVENDLCRIFEDDHPNATWRAFRQAVGSEILRFKCRGELQVMTTGYHDYLPDIENVAVLGFLERRVKFAKH